MLKTITLESVQRFIADGNVVACYPRKRVVVVDGFRRFAASAATLRWIAENSRAESMARESERVLADKLGAVS